MQRRTSSFFTFHNSPFLVIFGELSKNRKFRDLLEQTKCLFRHLDDPNVGVGQNRDEDDRKTDILISGRKGQNQDLVTEIRIPNLGFQKPTFGCQ